MMSPDYLLDIDGQEHEVDIDRLDDGGLLVVKVGSQSFTLKAEEVDEGGWSVNDTTNNYHLKIIEKSGKNAVVELNGHEYNVEWSRKREEHTSSAARAGSEKSTEVVAGGVYPPMPGTITEVHVDVGDDVEKGQTVCILEAMKMFNEMKSPADGTVKELHVKEGSKVTPNDLLAVIE
ncbi:MAG: biotin/lipoyl-containing protein [Promethearchaeia archaeon]